MANLKKRRGKWYARIQWRDKFGRMKEKQVPLRTTLKTDAYARLAAVERKEDDIRKGLEFSFPWLNGGGKTKIVRRMLKDTIDEYHAVKKINGIRQSTLERSQISLKTLTAILGASFPVQSITSSHITDWKEHWVKKHRPNTVNLNLSKIKAFFNWCRREQYILNSIEVEMVQADEKPVQYLSDSDLAKIMHCDAVDDHFKRAFLFYLETGCRRAEPFQATLAGAWILIEPDTAKSHRTREVQLTAILLAILNEMRTRYDDQINRLGYKPKNIQVRYSKEFKKACRAVGLNDHYLHNLRDTYAVRRWAVTGDIHLVSKEIGHASVKQTERYANFNLRRLQGDFPTLAKHIKRRLKKYVQEDYFLGFLDSEMLQINGQKDTDLKDTKAK